MRREFVLALVVLCTTAAGIAAIAAPEAAPQQSETAAVDERSMDRSADLRRLEEWLLIERSLDTATRVGALRELSRLDTSGYTEAEFYMLLRRITARAENGHSNVSSGPIQSRFGLLPLRAFWFADGLFIVRARDPHAGLVGARIDTIAGRDVDSLAAELMEYHGGHEAYFRAYTGPQLMLSPALLHAVGLAEEPGRLRLGVTLADGSSAEHDVAGDPGVADAPRVRPWRNLVPEPAPGEDPGWHTALEPGAPLPMFLHDAGELFRYELIAEGRAAYVQLRSNFGTQDNPVRDFVDGVQERLAADRPGIVILDNRFNPGGDLTRTADFALALPELAGPDGHVYVLTSGSTFSAGIYTSFYPRAADAERTTIVGEHVGDWTRFWAETWRPFILPDSGYRLAYSLQMHDLELGCDDPERCHIGSAQNPTPRWNVAVGSFEPDVPVPMTFADYRAGRDAALERVRELAGLEPGD